MRSLLSFILLALMSLQLTTAERITAKITDRRDTEKEYSYTVPERIQATSNTNVNCTAYPNSASCYGATRTTSSITAAHTMAYPVQGATFSLLLGDGKIVIVNCVSKYRLKADYINRRSCRAPLTNEIQVEFNKDDAKLVWPVSIDGKKLASETYKIIAVTNPGEQR